MQSVPPLTKSDVRKIKRQSLKSNEAPEERTLAVVDSETDPFEFGVVPQPFLWNYFNGVDHVQFTTTESLMSFLATLKDTVIYAHNGGKFDYHHKGFLNGLEVGDSVKIINGRLSQFFLHGVEFRDSVNILPMELKDFKDDAVGKVDIDIQKLHKDRRHNHMAEIIEYCKRDCVALFTLVKKFRDTYGDSLTLAGAALKFWLARSGEDEPKTDVDYFERIRKYYYGGRVECFRKGVIREKFRMLDINSAYPYAMLSNHPYDTFTVAVKVSKKLRINNALDYSARSMYRILAVSKGCLPFRGVKSLTFSDVPETLEFFVTGWEIKAGLETGSLVVERIVSVHNFVKTVNFIKYIGYFFDMKKASRKGSADYIFAKFMMNALSGKFASNPQEYSEYKVERRNAEEPAKDDGYKKLGSIGRHILLERDLPENKHRYLNVAVSASITGFVRAYLWRAICAVRRAGGEVLYCDTDSLAFIGPSVIPGIIEGKELGQWSDDGQFKGGGIAGKKMYAFEYETPKKNPITKKITTHKTGCKGVQFDERQIMRVCEGETVVYERPAPSRAVGKEARFITRRVKRT